MTKSATSALTPYGEALEKITKLERELAEAKRELAGMDKQTETAEDEITSLRKGFNEAKQKVETERLAGEVVYKRYRQAESRLVEAEKDAERYRWLRNRAWPFEFKGQDSDDADVAIDAEIIKVSEKEEKP